MTDTKAAAADEDEIRAVTKEIFSAPDAEQYAPLRQKAEGLIQRHGWDAVYPAWKEYLFTCCDTPEKVYDFAVRYEVYGGLDHRVRRPYDFLGYIMYRLGPDDPYRLGEIFLDIGIGMVSQAGRRREADEWYNPYYMPDQDPLILAWVRKYKKELG